MAPRGDDDRGARGGRRGHGDRGRDGGGGRSNDRRPDTRGGIRKRPGKAPAVDADGDRAMADVVTGQGGIRAPRGPRNQRPGRGGRDNSRSDRIQRGIQAGQGNVLAGRISKSEDNYTTSVRVLGLKASKAAKTSQDGGVKPLLEFIERKASKFPPESAIGVKKSHFEGDWLVLKSSPEDAAKIVMLNGFSFAGQKLTIQLKQPGVEYKEKKGLSEEAKETLKSVRSVLEERYVVADRLLNLSALGQDEKLVKMGFFNESSTVGKLFPVMMVVCNEIFTEPEKKVEFVPSISLARNAISGVSLINDLADTFPDLINLDLEFNQIQDLRSMDTWRHKFRKLERLRLNGNPITEIPSDYKERLMDWFPKLHVLNDIQIRTEAEVALSIERAKVAENVTPIPIGDWDFRDVANVALNFLPQFINLYDSDRNALADRFYDDQSIVSMSVNNRSPRRVEAHKEPVASWGAYLPKSRNLAQITHLPARMSRTHVGPKDIKAFWNALPPSKHPDLETEKEKWIVDCHALPGLPAADPTAQSSHGVDGLIISLHGEFIEADPSNPTTRALRSFSRTLILGPGNGLDGIRVISDMLTIRAHNTLPSIAPPAVQPDDLIKQDLVQKLSQHTLITLSSAEICLREANWDPSAAIIYFNAHKHEIPAEGWLSGVAPLN